MSNCENLPLKEERLDDTESMPIEEVLQGHVLRDPMGNDTSSVGKATGTGRRLLVAKGWDRKEAAGGQGLRGSGMGRSAHEDGGFFWG